MRRVEAFARSVLAGLVLAGAAAAQAQPGLNTTPLSGAAACGGFVRSDEGGPWDYRTEKGHYLKVSEEYHFKPHVEAVMPGVNGYVDVAGDIALMLRRFPNHHKALVAVMRLGEKLKTTQPNNLTYPIECWYDRALRWRPDDQVARMLYANFLLRNGRTDEALTQLDMVVKDPKSEALTQYNAGLLYFELKRPELALAQAHKAYGMGVAWPELRSKLQAAGQWREPESAAPASGTAASAPDGAASAPRAAASDAASAAASAAGR